MKRGAEKQLTKDNFDNDEDAEEGQGMRKAADTVLEGRRMAKLPNRARGGASAPTLASAPTPGSVFAPASSAAASSAGAEAPKSVFGGFGGFGGFGAGTTTAAPPAPVFGGFGTSAATAAAPPAAEAPKPVFPGFGTGTGSAFSFNAKPPSSGPPAAAAPAPAPAAAKPSNTPSFTMGDATTPSLSSSASSGANLFASILSSSSSPSKPAPLTNGTSAKKDEEKPADDVELQYYRSLRGLNESVLASMRKAVDADCSHDLGSFLDKYAEFRAGIQKEFDASKSTSSASSSVAPAAAPKPPAMPAPPAAFAGFGKPAAPAAAPPSVPASAFTFGASAAPASSASAAAKPSPFSFSSSAPTTGKPPSAGPAPPKSLFGSTDGSTSIFGAPKPKDAEAPAPSPFSGAELTPSSGTPFSFAGENPFGKPTGSGFSWGAPAPAAAAPAAAAPAAADADAAEPEAAPSLFPPAQHDLEGEGEEDEETAHSVKAKVYRMSKKTEEGIEKSYWADLGTGVLRLKKHKESPARRMLMRNSNTGKILINFSLYDGLDPTLRDKTVGFVGRDEEGKPLNFNVRVKTAEQAAELKGAIDREVQGVKDSA